MDKNKRHSKINFTVLKLTDMEERSQISVVKVYKVFHNLSEPHNHCYKV